MLQASRELLKKMDKMDLIKFSVSLIQNSPSIFTCMPVSFVNMVNIIYAPFAMSKVPVDGSEV